MNDKPTVTPRSAPVKAEKAPEPKPVAFSNAPPDEAVVKASIQQVGDVAVTEFVPDDSDLARLLASTSPSFTPPPPPPPEPPNRPVIAEAQRYDDQYDPDAGLPERTRIEREAGRRSIGRRR